MKNFTHITNKDLQEDVETHVTQEGDSEKRNSLIENLDLSTSYTRTENEALTYSDSGSALVNFFAQAGAMRSRPEMALELFKKAYAEDPEKAVRILFYIRDIRGGQGERDIFRACMEWVGQAHPAVFDEVVTHVPEYGRWDDMFFDNPRCFELIDTQLERDKRSLTPSLLAKWLPTINASSTRTRAKARFIAKRLGYSEKYYRKTLRDIRRKIQTVEEKMSAGQWSDITYSAVPSQAARIYRNAFDRHDHERYQEYLNQVQRGEEKINTATLYPYQIYRDAQNESSEALETLWSNLPDYTQGKNALVVADTSGSMYGNSFRGIVSPIAVSVSLALYFAERNEGPFKNHFITFSEEPKFQTVQGNTLLDKINSIEDAEWGYNTDLQKVFALLLNAAQQAGASEAEMPETIYIISDMEFDQCIRFGDITPIGGMIPAEYTNFESIEEEYQRVGYSLPNLVFWNVDARSGENLPVRQDQIGMTLVSGLSPVVFSMAVEGKTPYQLMLETIESERYQSITVSST